MAKIRMVGMTCDGDGLSGLSLDINFTNGQGILLPLTGKAHDPEFIKMYEDGRISRPKTDGERVYWIDGPSLSYAEILQMVRGDTE